MRAFRLAIFLPIAICALAANHPDWDQLRREIKTTLSVPDTLPSIEAKAYGKFSPAQGVDADRVSYSTAYELRVPAIVYHPAGATITRHPALVIVNGHGGDKSSWYAYWSGILYARAGAVVLTYDPIGEYERNRERRSKTGQHDQIVEPEEQMARRTAGLMITDVMQAVSYLLQRPDVDPKRIAVLGYSMGSFVSSVACAIDTRVHACVLVGGGNLDEPGGRWDTKGKPMCESLPYQSLKVLGDRGAVIYALHAKRGPTFVYNGTADNIVDINHHPGFFEDLRKRTVAELGSSKDVFDFAFQEGTGHAPYFVTKPVALWLEDKLKFPDWTKKQIEQIPETQISEWAQANHLPQDAVSSSEGKLMGLGKDIPAVPRDELHAVPEPVWDSQQDSYIYETWLERAKAAVTSGAP